MHRFLTSILQGAGFSLGASLIGLIVWFSAPWNRIAAEPISAFHEEISKPAQEAKIEIKSHEVQRRGDDTVVLGVLQNAGEPATKNFSIEAEFFDKNDKFVDVCKETVYSQRLGAGEAKNFKISCSSCRSKPMPEFSRYTVKVAPM